MEEPQVVTGDVVNLFFADAEAQGLSDDEQSFIILLLQEFDDIDEGLAFKLLHGNVVDTDFQGANGFEQGPFKAAVEGHDFARRLHLGAQGFIGQGEFFERPARKLDDAVVEGRFEAGRRLARNGISNLVQRKTGGHFGGNFGDGIARRFRSQGRRTADTRIDFDDVVLVAVRVEGILDVAAAFDFQAADDIEGCRAQHLILQVIQGLAGSDDDGSPVWMPDGSTFPMLQTMMQLSALSRMTSYSISFQPATERSTRI